MLNYKSNVNSHLTTFTSTPRIATPSAGFSLIEVMVALAVFALVATLAVPNIRNFVQNNQMSASANNLMGSLALARSEAIKRNTQVSVCASSSQTGCTGVDWNSGWIVFVDGEDPGVVDGTDEILNAVQGLPGGMDLASTDPYIQFKPNGSLAACQTCLLDIGKRTLAALFETMRGLAAQTIYMLLPGKMACAMDGRGNEHHCGDGHGHPGSGSGSTPTPDTTPTPDPAVPDPVDPAPVDPVVQAGIEMVLCNSLQTEETGRLFVISVSGHIRVSGYTCN